MKKGVMLLGLFLLLGIMFIGSLSFVSAVSGTVCNGSPWGWTFFQGGSADVNCDLRSDKCCSGTISTADSSSWVPSSCQDWSGVCTGGCTPTGRLVINYGSCITYYTYYQDLDGDGYGNPSVSVKKTSKPAGYVDNGDDCDDSNDSISPLAIEVCDTIDNNCDGSVNEGVCVVSNGIVENNGTYIEECDDGNIMNGDGCNENGTIESYNSEGEGFGWGCIINETGTSVCTENECVPESSEFQCGDEDLITRQTRTCVINDSSNAYNWEEWQDSLCGPGTQCVKTPFDTQCVSEGKAPILYCDQYNDSVSCSDYDSGVCEYSVNQHLRGLDELGYLEDQYPEEGFCDTGFPLYADDFSASDFGYDSEGYASCNYYAVNCSCIWNGEGCGPHFDALLKCDEVVLETGSCNYASSEFEDNCATSGTMTYTRRAVAEGITDETLAGEDIDGVICGDYTKTYQCVETAELPFFGVFGFITGLVLVGMVYWFFRRD